MFPCLQQIAEKVSIQEKWITLRNESARTAQHERVKAAFHDTDTNILADILPRIVVGVSGDFPVQLSTWITSGNHASDVSARTSRGCQCRCRCWCRGMRHLASKTLTLNGTTAHPLRLRDPTRTWPVNYRRMPRAATDQPIRLLIADATDGAREISWACRIERVRQRAKRCMQRTDHTYKLRGLVWCANKNVVIRIHRKFNSRANFFSERFINAYNHRWF